MAKAKKRVFVDCHVFDGKFQGTRTYIQGIYTELVQETEFHFYFAAHDIANLKTVFGDRPNVTYVKYRFGSRIMRLLLEAPWHILHHRINIAHFQYRVPPLKFCRYVVTIHDVLFEDFPEYFTPSDRQQSYHTYKFSAKHADAVLTVSEFSREEIRKYLGVDNAIITPNGIADVFFEEHDKAAIRNAVVEKYGFGNYIIYISRWEPRKNHVSVLRAFVKSGLYKTRQLVFVGGITLETPDYDAYLETLPAEIKEKVSNLGSVDFSTVLLLLRGADLFVYPSMAEGFGIPPLEAIAAGVPVVSSNATAMADFDFIADRMFNPVDVDELSEKMVTALNGGREETARLKEIVRKRYSWKDSAAIVKSVLSRL